MLNCINNAKTETLQHLIDGKRFSIPEARAFLDTEGDILLLFPIDSLPYVSGDTNSRVRREAKNKG